VNSRGSNNLYSNSKGRNSVGYQYMSSNRDSRGSRDSNGYQHINRNRVNSRGSNENR